MDFKAKTVMCEGIKPFEFSIKKLNLTQDTHPNNREAHLHDKCEIYINLTGNVSILVEDNIYPVRYGDVCITRAGEKHCCIYNSDMPHEHYWILFSAEGNEELLDVFFKRPHGQDNLLVLSIEAKERLLQLCSFLLYSKQSDLKKQIDFWNIIDILNGCAQKGNLKNVKRYPDVVIALNYINENFMDTINIKTLAEKSYVSVSTLERHFLTVFGMSPIQYVRQQRIMHAAELLKSGESITDVAMKCGFNDYSRFIAMFKQHYGITPLRYQKVNLDLNVRETL